MPASGSSIGSMPGGFNHYEQSLRIVDVLENDGRGLNLTWEVRDGIAKHSKGKSGAPVGMPTAAAREHDRGADHARRGSDRLRQSRHRRRDAGGAAQAGRPAARSGRDARRDLVGPDRRRWSRTWSPRRWTASLTEIRMSPPILDAVLGLRAFLFDAVYENTTATAEFRKASDILSGLWEKVRERPDEFLDAKTVEAEGLDAATRDFVAGMTDRYAIRLFEQLFIPKPWAID